MTARTDQRSTRGFIKKNIGEFRRGAIPQGIKYLLDMRCVLLHGAAAREDYEKLRVGFVGGIDHVKE